MAKHELYKKVTQAYMARFQQPPQLVVRAPGRVNLIGEHTDYNDGFVLPIATEQETWAAAAPRRGRSRSGCACPRDPACRRLPPGR